MRMSFVLLIISGALLVGILVMAFNWLHTILEFTPIVITARDKTVHFFDTQEITQKITMEQPARIVRLEIPWHPPIVDTPVIVDIRRHEKLLFRWRIRTVGNGSKETLSLVFPTPQYIDGILDVSFRAPEISREQLENAPKLFLEPFDGSFTSGNFRIGDDEKQGDIPMRFVAERERIEVVRQNFIDDPWRSSGTLLGFLAFLCLVMAFPYVFYRSIQV